MVKAMPYETTCTCIQHHSKQHSWSNLVNFVNTKRHISYTHTTYTRDVYTMGGSKQKKTAISDHGYRWALGHENPVRAVCAGATEPRNACLTIGCAGQKRSCTNEYVSPQNKKGAKTNVLSGDDSATLLPRRPRKTASHETGRPDASGPPRPPPPPRLRTPKTCGSHALLRLDLARQTLSKVARRMSPPLLSYLLYFFQSSCRMTKKENTTANSIPH